MSTPRVAILILSVSLALAHRVTAEDHEGDPPDLRQARGAFETQVRAATLTLRQRYLAQLELLKQQYTARGNAEGVLAVQNEINRVREAGGLAAAFDWQRLRAMTSYSYADPSAFSKSMAYVDASCAKLLDRRVGETFSHDAVGWQEVVPSPIVFKFTRPLLPSAIRLHVFGSDVKGGVKMPESIRVTIPSRSARGETIAERHKIPDRTGWVELPFALKQPVEQIRVEIEAGGKLGWTILDEVEFR